MTRTGAALALVLVSCKAVDLPPPEPEIIIVEPGDDASDDDRSTCGRACARLDAFGCHEAEPSPGGIPCRTICKRSGVLLDAECVAGARTLTELHGCNVRCAH